MKAQRELREDETLVFRHIHAAWAGIFIVGLAASCGGGASTFAPLSADAGGGDGGGSLLSSSSDDSGLVLSTPDATTGTGPKDASLGTDSAGDAATQSAVCGDGVIESGETCDDGN